MILVDTNVWSLVFRRRAAVPSTVEAIALRRVRMLIDANEAAMIGPVRQEVLSGVKTVEQFARLRDAIDGVYRYDVDMAAHDLAADSYSRCRAKGIAADHIDMMVCAVAIRHAVPILTLDADFQRYATAVPIALAWS